jgi:hypothetical protein
MKKRVYRSCLTFLVLTVLWAVPFLHAQSSPLICKVPFKFIVGQTSLPSGQYTVQPVSFGSPAIIIQKDDGRGNVITLTNPPQTGQAQDNKGKLVFHKSGNRYFLFQIWHSSGAGRELFPSSLERELARKISKPESTILTAQKR